MNRRAFVRGFAGVGATWSSAGHAQSLFDGLLSKEPRAANGRAWQWRPSIAIVSGQNDLRLKAVHQAVGFWNAELSKLGTPFRLGSAYHIVGPLPAKEFFLWTPQAPDRALPEEFRQIDSDIILALSNDEFRSHTRRWLSPSKRVVVGISSEWANLIVLPNRVPNVVAHELGHAIGLDHNAEPDALMCGTPHRCRFPIPEDGFLPLNDVDKAALAEMYPPDWNDQFLVGRKVL